MTTPPGTPKYRFYIRFHRDHSYTYQRAPHALTAAELDEVIRGMQDEVARRERQASSRTGREQTAGVSTSPPLGSPDTG